MNKEELERDMESIIRNILNPYNNRDPEVEAWLLIEDGWIKQQEAKWLVRTFTSFDIEKVGFNCSNCNTTWDVPTNYCPHCGAKMIKED